MHAVSKLLRRIFARQPLGPARRVKRVEYECQLHGVRGAQLGGADFQVVALSMDAGTKGLDLVKSFYAAEGIKHLAIYQDADAAAIFKLKAVGVPTTLLLDRQGREIGRMSGTAEWDAPQIVEALRALLRAEPA